MKEIEEINFPFLSELWLRDNQIESIEGINRISLPKLKALLLGKNQITNVKEVRKISSNELNNIDIGMILLRKMRASLLTVKNWLN